MAKRIVINVTDARNLGPNEWIVDEVRTEFPDGGYDVGGAGVKGTTQDEAEETALTVASERLASIRRGNLAASNPKR